jgi:hypothetical protein
MESAPMPRKGNLDAPRGSSVRCIFTGLLLSCVLIPAGLQAQPPPHDFFNPICPGPTPIIYVPESGYGCLSPGLPFGYTCWSLGPPCGYGTWGQMVPQGCPHHIDLLLTAPPSPERPPEVAPPPAKLK